MARIGLAVYIIPDGASARERIKLSLTDKQKDVFEEALQLGVNVPPRTFQKVMVVVEYEGYDAHPRS